MHIAWYSNLLETTCNSHIYSSLIHFQYILFVTAAPNITAPPMSVSVVSPDPAMFSCTADGVPRPNITWCRVDNGTEMEVMEDSFTRITTTLNDVVTMSLLTFNRTQPSMSGVYVCTATSLLHIAKKMVRLRVNGKLTSPL